MAVRRQLLAVIHTGKEVIMKHVVSAVIAAATLTLGVAALLTVTASPGASASQVPIKTVVTVYGTGSTAITPTRAQVMLGVFNQASSAQSALSENNRIMDTVIGAVETLGVPKTAIATNGLNINPVYNQSNPPEVTNYQVSDNLTINISVSLVGKVIDRAVAHGANQVNGINFTTAGNAQYRKTYRDALANARAQAQAVASGLGEHVLGATSITVQQNQSSGPLPLVFDAAAAHTPILPGQQQESVTVKVVFELGR
jgi:hypothetical protein